jgi:hypothetical protein
MALPEVVMSDSFRGADGAARPRLSPVQAAGLQKEPAESSARGRARVFWGLGFAWLVASIAVAAQLFQSGVEHRSAVARTGGVSFSIR